MQRLKKTGAKLIFAATTIVPDGESGRIVGDDAKYNEAALRVMKKYDGTVNDRHELTTTFGPELFVGPGNMRFKTEGSEKLAAQVAARIAAARNRRPRREVLVSIERARDVQSFTANFVPRLPADDSWLSRFAAVDRGGRNAGRSVSRPALCAVGRRFARG